MNWEAIGAIGETVGAMAVLLTLFYLAMQIRQNTKSVQAAAVDSANTQVSRVREVLLSSADLASIYRRGTEDPFSLSEDDMIRYRLLMHNIFVALSNSLMQASLTSNMNQGDLPVLNRVLSTTGGRWFWDAYRHEFEESFRGICDDLCAETFDERPMKNEAAN